MSVDSSKTFIDILKRPQLIILLTAYGLLYEYLPTVVSGLPIPLFIFLRPVVYSYIISYLFIEAIDVEKRGQHKKIAFSLYVPFLTIEINYALSFFLLSIVLRFLFPHVSASDNISFWLNVFTYFVVVLRVFWLVACVFEKGHTWTSFRKAATQALSHPLLYALIYSVSLTELIITHTLGLSRFTAENFLFRIGLITIVSVAYVFFYKVIILIFYRAADSRDACDTLDYYFQRQHVPQ